MAVPVLGVLIGAAGPFSRPLLAAPGGSATGLVSINSAGSASGNNTSDAFAVSAGGRHVVFQSRAGDLVTTPKGNAAACGSIVCRDVFVRDLIAGTTTLVSIDDTGSASGNDNSYSGAIDADGRYVVFLSAASDLVTTPKGTISCGQNSPDGKCYDVFMRDLTAGTTTLVSVNSAGSASAIGNSTSAAISADGRYVAFESTASDLVTTPKGSDPGACTGDPCPDIFVRDLATGTTTLVSVNDAGSASGNERSKLAAISADGGYVVFQSLASDLVGNDTNGEYDVFVRDLTAATTTLVSIDSTSNASGNRQSTPGAISADGRYVAFRSTATNLVANDTNGATDVFVRDLTTATTALVSITSAGSASDRGAGGTQMVGITPDARYVVFQSGSSNLVATPKGTGPNIFVRDLTARTTTLVSVNSAGSAGGNDSSQSCTISPDGRYVVFESRATDLATTPIAAVPNIFVRDLTAGTTTLVSVNSAGTASGGSSVGFGGAITLDGRYVVFRSNASNLVANDTNGTEDVFVRDLAVPTPTLTGTPTSTLAATATSTSTQPITPTPTVIPTGTPTSTSTATTTPSGTPTPTPSATATGTATPTFMPANTATPSQTPTVAATFTPTLIVCAGDCDDSGEVTVNEIIILVTIDLGTAEASACPNGIPLDTQVDITLIVKAVGYALAACPAG